MTSRLLCFRSVSLATSLAALALTFLPTATAAAQDLLPRVRVTRDDTTIRAMRYNRNDMWLLTHADAGAEFDVLDVDGDDRRFSQSNYYLVLLPRDPWGTQWVGWISGKYLESAPPLERTRTSGPSEPMMVTYGSRRPAPAPAPARAARPVVASVAEPTSVPDVVLNFGFDRSDLTEAAKNTLATALNGLGSDVPRLSFALAGHADSVGSETYNQKLGLARAEQVRKYIVEQLHIPENQISVASLGETQPVAPNDTKDGRAENRRVVVQVTIAPRAIGN